MVDRRRVPPGCEEGGGEEEIDESASTQGRKNRKRGLRAHLQQLAQAIQEPSRVLNVLNHLDRTNHIKLPPLLYEFLRRRVTVLERVSWWWYRRRRGGGGRGGKRRVEDVQGRVERGVRLRNRDIHRRCVDRKGVGSESSERLHTSRSVPASLRDGERRETHLCKDPSPTPNIQHVQPLQPPRPRQFPLLQQLLPQAPNPRGIHAMEESEFALRVPPLCREGGEEGDFGGGDGVC